ncbi:TatD family hydrolase [Bacillaceae bacterium]
MIDAHLHLERYAEEQVERFIAEWQERGIAGVVAVSTDLASAYRTLELQRKHPRFVHAAVGYHPEQPLPKPAELAELLDLLEKERSRIAAVGEIGLPHYALERLGFPSLEPYLDMLQIFCDKARELDLPVLLHAVHDKAEAALQLLLQRGVEKAHFHWLKAPPETVERILAAGYFISVTPEAVYRKRDQDLAAMIPLAQLLLETDGPWPYSGPFTGRPTTPLFLRETAAAVARLKGKEPREIWERCRCNCLRLLAIKDSLPAESRKGLLP